MKIANRSGSKLLFYSAGNLETIEESAEKVGGAMKNPGRKPTDSMAAIRGAQAPRSLRESTTGGTILRPHGEAQAD